MILYDYPLFKMSRKFLLLVGQWPHDVGNRKYLIRAVICLVPISVCVIEIHELISTKRKFQQIVRVLPVLSFLMVAFLKYLTCWIKIEVIENALEFIALDRDALRSENEIEIMKRSAAEGWTLGKSYILTMFAALIGIVLPFFTPSILDLIKPLNESRTEKLLTESGYLTNIQGCSFYVILNVQCVVVVGVVVALAADLLYIAVLYYVSGMYCIAGYRLEHMFDNVQLMPANQKKAVIRQRVLNVVTQQLNIIKGTKFVTSCYTMSFAAQFFIIVIAIAATLVNIHDTLTSQNLVVVFALGFAMLGYYFGVFVNITPGQNLMDRSSDLLYKLYSSEWYQAPVKSQKLLLFMMQKAQKPFILSAEGILNMTYETCSMILQTSFSYFMMMSSIEE